MLQKLTGIASQRGASVTSIILLTLVILVAGKLLIAIVPAQIGDYQLTKILTDQLQQANLNNETAKQFIARVDRQLTINGDSDSKVEDRITFTNKKIGQLAVYKKYVETHKFFANIDIVSRSEGGIEFTPVE
ncbi:DUF4845 domain-containing protein [Psychrobacter urativorans]|uniref:DUF4845 domain-containing protein n=1 Tax=Psychrobacter urativorans TaxID=45610 RepID=UPI001918E4E9|nr:DUF4845 domain-containing protein [Psychrobacter urativorans]